MSIFTVYNARDGRKMHADILGNILEHHRLYPFDAVIEKIALPRDDTLDDAIDRLPAVLDVSQQVDRRADLFLDKIPGFLCRIRLVQHAVIGRTDTKPG